MANRQVLIGVTTILFTIAVIYFFSRVILTQPAGANADTNWNQVGTLVYNNPGMKANTWFLIYEEPGQPALSKELQFDSASACAINAPAAPCNPATIPVGAHVRVEGRLVGEGVLVRTIQLPETFASETEATSTTATTTQTKTATSTTKAGTSSQPSTQPSKSNGNATSTATSSPLGEPMSVKLYYYNPALDTSSSSVQCSSKGLVAVSRTIQRTNTPLQDTLKLLLRGELSNSEKGAGLVTEFPLSGVTLLSANNDNGTLTLTFRDPKNRTSGGSCRVSIMWAEIEATAKQFPGVSAVRYIPETLFQP